MTRNGQVIEGRLHSTNRAQHRFWPEKQGLLRSLNWFLELLREIKVVQYFSCSMPLPTMKCEQLLLIQCKRLLIFFFFRSRSDCGIKDIFASEPFSKFACGRFITIIAVIIEVSTDFWNCHARAKWSCPSHAVCNCPRWELWARVVDSTKMKASHNFAFPVVLLGASKKIFFASGSISRFAPHASNNKLLFSTSHFTSYWIPHSNPRWFIISVMTPTGSSRSVMFRSSASWTKSRW